MGEGILKRGYQYTVTSPVTEINKGSYYKYAGGDQTGNARDGFGIVGYIPYKPTAGTSINTKLGLSKMSSSVSGNDSQYPTALTTNNGNQNDAFGIGRGLNNSYYRVSYCRGSNNAQGVQSSTTVGNDIEISVCFISATQAKVKFITDNTGGSTVTNTSQPTYNNIGIGGYYNNLSGGEGTTIYKRVGIYGFKVYNTSDTSLLDNDHLTHDYRCATNSSPFLVDIKSVTTSNTSGNVTTVTTTNGTPSNSLNNYTSDATSTTSYTTVKDTSYTETVLYKKLLTQ